jgi:hypothetical protein
VGWGDDVADCGAAGGGVEGVEPGEYLFVAIFRERRVCMKKLGGEGKVYTKELGGGKRVYEGVGGGKIACANNFGWENGIYEGGGRWEKVTYPVQ